MTPLAQQIAIAKICGIYICQGCNHEVELDVCWCGDSIGHGSHEGHSPVRFGCTCGYVDARKRKSKKPDCPNYVNDLNAMKSAEMYMTNKRGFHFSTGYYTKALPLVVGGSEGCWEIVSATSEQRAKAFLMTFDKWDDTK